MEVLGTAGFIGLVVIALTQVVRYLSKGAVSGVLTIIVAIVIGVFVSLLTPYLGLADITVAQAIGIALAAVGVHTTASAVNTSPTVVR